jgi:hypothetical protein
MTLSGLDPGQCFEYACTDATSTPGLRKRAALATQHIVKQRLCPRGYEPCPVVNGGFEVSYL